MIIYIVSFSPIGNSGKNKATREKAKALEKKLGKENFEFIHPTFSQSRFKTKINKLLFDFTTFRRILFIKNVDVVVQRALFMPITRLLLYIKRVKVISEYHADFREEIPHYNKSKPEKAFLFLLAWFYDLNYKLSDGIIYNHPYLKDKFDKVYNKPSIYSYNGANITDFNIQSTEISRNLLSIGLQHKVFLFLGSVSKWHGVDYLIEIFNTNTLLMCDDIKLYIVGGNDNDYIRSLKEKSEINANIIFVSAVDNKQAANYISAADYCLLPVKQIRTSPGSPLKLYDYIACGKPVIGQENVFGYSDEIEKYNLGYTVDFTKSKEAALKLHTLAYSSKAEFFEKNNREIAQTKVSWGNRIEKWHDFILSLIND